MACIQMLGDIKDASLKATRCNSDLPGWWRLAIDNDKHTAAVLVSPDRMRELIGELMKDPALRSEAAAIVGPHVRSGKPSGVMG
jgi:hypothetical protein